MNNDSIEKLRRIIDMKDALLDSFRKDNNMLRNRVEQLDSLSTEHASNFVQLEKRLAQSEALIQARDAMLEQERLIGDKLDRHCNELIAQITPDRKELVERLANQDAVIRFLEKLLKDTRNDVNLTIDSISRAEELIEQAISTLDNHWYEVEDQDNEWIDKHLVSLIPRKEETENG